MLLHWLRQGQIPEKCDIHYFCMKAIGLRRLCVGRAEDRSQKCVLRILYPYGSLSFAKVLHRLRRGQTLKMCIPLLWLTSHYD